MAADSAQLARRGYPAEAVGMRSDRARRIELVTRTLQPILEQYWAAGERPNA